MRAIFLLACFATLLFAAPACTTPTENTTKSQGITYHKDVRPLLESRCVQCHQEGGVGPYNLDTYADASKVRELIKAQVVSRKMPPWHADKSCNTYQGDISLTDEQIETFKKWAEGDAPEGNTADYKPMGRPEEPAMTKIDLSVKLPVRYAPKQRPDDYRCFIVDWPYSKEDGARYVTGFRVNPDNKRIVHHVIAFIAPPELVESFQKLDDDEEGPGYTCFGGPGGESKELLRIGWLGAWAPGSAGAVYSTNNSRGIKVEGGSKLIIQMHYNILNDKEESDQSSIEFQIAESVQQSVKIQPWTNPQWVGFLGPKTMEIPAGQSEVKHAWANDPTSYITSGKPLEVLSGTMHMHKLGKTGKISIQHTDGTETCILDVKSWDFNWQRAYVLSKPITIKPGEKLAIQCSWDNSPENQPFIDGIRITPREVNWGEGTFDEMCLGLVSYVIPQ
ncbi:MAG: monooxygenase [Myxococcales bacterium]|nr:monooxygenase [Myxococcales bacterium]